MPNFKRYGQLPTVDFMLELVKEEDFSRESLRETMPNQKHTRVLVGLYDILDGMDGFGDRVLFEKYYPYLQGVINAIKVEYRYEYIEFKSLILVKLLANESISEHTDEDGIYKYTHRLHVPLITNNECVFTIGGEDGTMSYGEIVEINNTVTHSVQNGSEDRVHLIVDIMGFHDRYNLNTLDNPIPEQFYIN